VPATCIRGILTMRINYFSTCLSQECNKYVTFHICVTLILETHCSSCLGSWCFTKYKGNRSVSISSWFTLSAVELRSRGSSVSILTMHGMDERGASPITDRNFSFRHRVQTDSGDGPSSYPMGIGVKRLRREALRLYQRMSGTPFLCTYVFVTRWLIKRYDNSAVYSWLTCCPSYYLLRYISLHLSTCFPKRSGVQVLVLFIHVRRYIWWMH
jgi:hypothetical protein